MRPGFRKLRELQQHVIGPVGESLSLLILRAGITIETARILGVPHGTIKAQLGTHTSKDCAAQVASGCAKLSLD